MTLETPTRGSRSVARGHQRRQPASGASLITQQKNSEAGYASWQGGGRLRLPGWDSHHYGSGGLQQQPHTLPAAIPRDRSESLTCGWATISAPRVRVRSLVTG